MPYGYYGYYGTTPYLGAGHHLYQPEISASPAFQWGYAAASQYAQKIPKRRRRALSAEPVTATSAGGVTVQYASKGTSSEYPLHYPGPRSRRAAIDRKLDEIEYGEYEEPLVAPVSLSSLRSRLLAACDLNDGAKRLYERYNKDVEEVGGYTRKY